MSLRFPQEHPKRRPVLRLIALTLSILLVASACTSGSDDDERVIDLDGNDILLTAALVTVDNCDALLERIIAEAVERVGPYGFGGFHGFGGPEIFAVDDMAMEESAEAATDAVATSAGSTARAAGGDGAAAAPQEGTDFSGTNNQEEGVDEADLVKTDGRILVTVQGQRLSVVDVSGDTPRLTKTIKLPDEFYGGELFLDGDTALLMTSGWTSEPFVATSRIAADWYPGSPTGRLMEIDLDRGAVVRTLEFEGSYLSAREIDGSIRIVLSASENRFNFVYPSNEGAEDAAERANRSLIEESTIDMWIPTYRITEDGETVTEGPIVDCNRVHLPTEFAGFGSLVVLTADIRDGLAVNDALSVFTDGNTVYASPDRLAVATPRWPTFDENGEPRGEEGYRTAIHSFDISDPRRSEYAASGTVRGTMLNQYSMSEHEGYLRVATTDGTPWDSRNSESFVTVLTEDGGELVETGQVGGLGKGERIFAVRFLGDTAYVVTFEQIDPLYTIDLSDPDNPVARGELKIPGVSEYLHPYGDGLLIGIGTDGNDEGLTWGAVASLFDVSDPDNPTQVAKLPLGPDQGERFESGSYSPVANDARAFTIWGDTFMVPVGWWSYSEDENGFEENNGAGVQLIRVDGKELQTVGQIGHPIHRECEGRVFPTEGGEDGVVVSSGGATSTPVSADESDDAEANFVRNQDEEAPAAAVEVRPGPDGFCWSHQPQIMRTIIIGENLYTVSDAGVAVNSFDGLDTVTWIPFER